MGYVTRTAHNGPAALQVAGEFVPDVALLDIGLPGMDGYELARRLRERATTPLAIIALTGYGAPGDEHQASASGFDAHLVKPVTIESLAATLDELMERNPPPARPGYRPDGDAPVGEVVDAPGKVLKTVVMRSAR